MKWNDNNNKIRIEGTLKQIVINHNDFNTFFSLSFFKDLLLNLSKEEADAS